MADAEPGMRRTATTTQTPSSGLREVGKLCNGLHGSLLLYPNPNSSSPHSVATAQGLARAGRGRRPKIPIEGL
eukprot:9493716-Pyramimonas_sp.AAC.1